MDLYAFEQKIKAYIEADGRSQAAVARKLGYSPDTFNKWVRGVNRMPYNVIHEFSRFLRLTESQEEELYKLAGYARRPPTAEPDGLDWPNASETSAAASLQDVLSPNSEPPPIQTPQLPYFHVRPKQLEETILDAFKDKQVQTLVLWGPGGAGKTTLAAWVAQLLAPSFTHGVIWITVQATDAMADVLEAIAESLGLVSTEGTLATQARKVHSRLRQRRCLLVLDDLVAMPELTYLRLGSETSQVLCTTRDRKVADLLQAPLLQVTGVTEAEGLTLLSYWAGYRIKSRELVTRLGGLPLALSLCGAQLRAGTSLDSLLAALRKDAVDLSLLDMDDPQMREESLSLCFDLSYNRLAAMNKQRFAWLGYFAGRRFSQEALAAVWGVSPTEARATLNQLLRFALLERSGLDYQLHPLLHVYTRLKWSAALPQENDRAIRHRHATWHIRYVLYHPGLVDSPEQAPDLEQSWADVVAGVRWAATHAPHLAVQAAVLAHTERGALLEAVGPTLIEAGEAYLRDITNQLEQASLHEIVGDLHLLDENFAAGAGHFERASRLWHAVGNDLASSRTKLRLAGAYLLRQDQAAAAVAARQAQSLLAPALPISVEALVEARTLFYWFQMVYNPLIRWADLPEDDVAALARLAEQTEQPILHARGVRIHALWCLTRVADQSDPIRQQGRDLALQAYGLWCESGRRDQADDEISFAQYYLKNRYSRLTARRFAQRQSQHTPQVGPAQSRLLKNEGIRWWLEAQGSQRVAWLSWMLPRYLGVDNRPRHPVRGTYLPKLQLEDRAYRWVTDILNVGMLGEGGRRLMTGHERPTEHFLNGPEWRVLRGERVLALTDRGAKQLVKDYLKILEIEG